MEDKILIAVIAAVSAVAGGLIASLTNFLISRRQISRSGARLLTDLQILEKAKSVELEPILIDAIQGYVRRRVEWHTHTPIVD